MPVMPGKLLLFTSSAGCWAPLRGSCILWCRVWQLPLAAGCLKCPLCACSKMLSCCTVHNVELIAYAQ